MQEVGRVCIPNPTARRVSPVPFPRSCSVPERAVPDSQSRAILVGSAAALSPNEMSWWEVQRSHVDSKRNVMSRTPRMNLEHSKTKRLLACMEGHTDSRIAVRAVTALLLTR
jgi:hypothetical protein